MKRKLLFLQYILKQDKNSMIFKILKATEENPVKNDFVYTCKKYLQKLKLTLTLIEIKMMSKFKLRKLLKEKIKDEALVYTKRKN